MSMDQFCDLPNGFRLCYRTHGHPDGDPLLLIAGLGLQLTYWSPLITEDLARRGYRVITMDNRDVGRSSRATGKPPGLLRSLSKRIEASAYDLDDMTRDTAGLLAHLHVDRVHVVGMSMGGMIAQNLAALYPDQVRSLTSIFSTTGAGRVGQPALSTLLRLAKAPPRSREEAVAGYLRMMRHIGSTGHFLDEQSLRSYAEQAWDRGHGANAHEGMARQVGAIMKSGDRTARLRGVRAPTLVIHGDQDRMVAPSGGQATADAIPGAVHLTVRGMGHDLPDDVIPYLVDLIDGHAERHSEALNPSSLTLARQA
ncbi:alpha/beta fold hydrolase [Aquabacterium sp.]|uniref:alpha/beta fold hydrolase n=1 Tax=Aquabacterium sp. TaxID=1872578 RepID=UPI003D6D1CC4